MNINWNLTNKYASQIITARITINKNVSRYLYLPSDAASMIGIKDNNTELMIGTAPDGAIAIKSDGIIPGYPAYKCLHYVNDARVNSKELITSLINHGVDYVRENSEIVDFSIEWIGPLGIEHSMKEQGISRLDVEFILDSEPIDNGIWVAKFHTVKTYE